jgi:hypothetical protein
MNCMNRWIVGVSIGAIASLVPSQAQAQTPFPFSSCLQSGSQSQSLYVSGSGRVLETSLSVADLRSSGDCLLTRDAKTGLEWLDLNATTRQSYDSIAAGFGGYLADGFRFADKSEVETFFGNAIASVELSSGVVGRRTLLPETIGFTFATFGRGGTIVDGYGIFGSPDAAGNVGRAQYQYGTNNGGFPSFSGDFYTQGILENFVSSTNADISQGALLVRSTPPTAIPTPALLPGILGFVAAMRRRMRQEAEA